MFPTKYPTNEEESPWFAAEKAKEAAFAKQEGKARNRYHQRIMPKFRQDGVRCLRCSASCLSACGFEKRPAWHPQYRPPPDIHSR